MRIYTAVQNWKTRSRMSASVSLLANSTFNCSKSRQRSENQLRIEYSWLWWSWSAALDDSSVRQKTKHIKVFYSWRDERREAAISDDADWILFNGLADAILTMFKGKLVERLMI